jgi:hypothetical protein
VTRGWAGAGGVVMRALLGNRGDVVLEIRTVVARPE